MLTYISLACIIKIAKLLLGKPHSLPCKFHIYAGFSALALVYDYLIVVIHKFP